uniref:Transglycosylase SLT domain-containing protein n=1 Tax=Thermosporothrix sp. COM3 TaxID=2490863 RepID=A0A455SP76_9CHLR|nr:hypothetical protein KTC_41910 [Thermosporothrix sp. COM3]
MSQFRSRVPFQVEEKPSPPPLSGPHLPSSPSFVGGKAGTTEAFEFSPIASASNPVRVPTGQLSTTKTPTGQLLPTPYQPTTGQMYVLTGPLTDGLVLPQNRQAVVIPGSKKKRQNTTVQRQPLPARVRFSIVAIMLFCFFISTLVSFSPVGTGQKTTPFSGSIAEWLQRQQNWNTIGNSGVPVRTNQEKPPANVPDGDYVAMARAAARAAGIPEEYFVKQIDAETGFNPNAMSPVGAMGIAQFMPDTAASLGIDPWNPEQALYAAARMMSSLYKTYGDYAKALAAYNYGSGNLQTVLNACGSGWMGCLPGETRAYIYKIMGI